MLRYNFCAHGCLKHENKCPYGCFESQNGVGGVEKWVSDEKKRMDKATQELQKKTGLGDLESESWFTECEKWVRNLF